MDDVSAQDITLPKMLLMQGLSKLVSSGEARMGEIRDSLTRDLLGGQCGKEMKPVSFIPVHLTMLWTVFEKRAGKDVWVGTEPMTAHNHDLPINEVKNGIEIRRDRTMNVIALRPEDIKAGEAFPYVISFRRYSFPAGKDLAAYGTKLKMTKKPLAYFTFQLESEKQENEKGVFFKYILKKERVSTPEEISEAKNWFDIVSKVKVKVDDSDLESETSDTANSGSSSETIHV